MQGSALCRRAAVGKASRVRRQYTSLCRLVQGSRHSCGSNFWRRAAWSLSSSGAGRALAYLATPARARLWFTSRRVPARFAARFSAALLRFCIPAVRAPPPRSVSLRGTTSRLPLRPRTHPVARPQPGPLSRGGGRLRHRLSAESMKRPRPAEAPEAAPVADAPPADDDVGVLLENKLLDILNSRRRGSSC